MSKRVLVLYGGQSSEHPISCLSADSVSGVIDRDAYDVVTVGIARDGRWYLTDGVAQARAGALPEVTPQGAPVSLVRADDGVRLVRLGEAFEDIGNIDVVFPLLHGPMGEDGTIQGHLATLGVAYVGPDVASAAISMDKRAMRAAFAARDLPMSPHVDVHVDRYRQDKTQVLDEIEAEVGPVMFTKPARLGSSIGIAKVSSREELMAGLEDAFQYGQWALVERAVPGAREIEVAVLGNREISLTQPGEIIPCNDFYDFEAKYLDDSELVIPAKLDTAIETQVMELAAKAYAAVGCRGLARVDMFVDVGDHVLLNELNAIPGFTSKSMYPLLWQNMGLSYPELVSKLLDLAFEAAVPDNHYAP